MNTDAGISMFESFYKHFFSIKADAAREHAMYNFGKIQRRYRKNINVQKTSISRQKTKIGGSQVAQKGRPVGIRKVEHDYSAKSRKPRRAPHSLSFCTARNISLGAEFWAVSNWYPN